MRARLRPRCATCTTTPPAAPRSGPRGRATSPPTPTMPGPTRSRRPCATRPLRGALDSLGAGLRAGNRACAFDLVMRRLLTLLALCVALLAPAVAHAASGADKLLIDACRDEHVDGHYTQAQFKKALEELPADSDEYTACRQVIEDARLAQLANRGGGGTG